MPEWTDSPDGGSRAGQLGDHSGAHQKRSQREPGWCRKRSDAHTSPLAYWSSTCSITHVENNAVILTASILEKKREKPWRSTWMNLPHSGLVHQASGTIMMTLPTPVLTKWQDLMADQHPASSAASPYIRTHSRTQSTHACLQSTPLIITSFIYDLLLHVAHSTLICCTRRQEQQSVLYRLPVLHTLWHCMFYVSMRHRVPMSTWYDQLVGTGRF